MSVLFGRGAGPDLSERSRLAPVALRYGIRVVAVQNPPFVASLLIVSIISHLSPPHVVRNEERQMFLALRVLLNPDLPRMFAIGHFTTTVRTTRIVSVCSPGCLIAPSPITVTDPRPRDLNRTYTVRSHSARKSGQLPGPK